MTKHDNQQSSKDIRFQTAIDQLTMMRATGAIRHPGLSLLWKIGNSSLAQGKYADEAHAKLSRIIGPMVLAQQLMPPRPLRLPSVPAEAAILLGSEVGTRRPILIHRNALGHTLLVGATSMGKSRLIFSIVDQIMKQNARRA